MSQPTREWSYRNTLLSKVFAALDIPGSLDVSIHERILEDYSFPKEDQDRLEYCIPPERSGFYEGEKKVGELYFMESPMRIVVLDDSFEQFALALKEKLEEGIFSAQIEMKNSCISNYLSGIGVNISRLMRENHKDLLFKFPEVYLYPNKQEIFCYNGTTAMLSTEGSSVVGRNAAVFPVIRENLAVYSTTKEKAKLVFDDIVARFGVEVICEVDFAVISRRTK